MKVYGIPYKPIKMIVLMYTFFECSVMNGDLTDSFKIITGDKQGCLMSSFSSGLYQRGSVPVKKKVLKMVSDRT